MSDSEDGIDMAAHGKLISSIQSLDGKKKQKNAIRGMPVAPNNLDLVVHASTASSKIKAADLKMKQRHGKTELKKPLSSDQLEVAKRQIARETMVQETSKWDPVVKNWRMAPQVNYTKHNNEAVEMAKRKEPWGFVPSTPLELELFTALGKSEDILRPDKQYTEAEEKALKAMSFKEAQMRRKELMKHHELLSKAGLKEKQLAQVRRKDLVMRRKELKKHRELQNRAELRAKRLRKIKSKNYRKILRKEKEAKTRKELEQLQKTNPEAFNEKMLELDRARMEERLTLKHKGGGKFSRLHKAYSKFDDKTRTAVQDMLQKSKELTQKREDPSSSEEDEGDETLKPSTDDDIDEDGVAVEVHSKISNVTPSAIAKLAGGWLDGPTKYVYTTQKTDAPKDFISLKETGDRKEESLVKQSDNKEIDEERTEVDVEESLVNAEKSKEEELKKTKKRKRKSKSPGDEGVKVDSTIDVSLTVEGGDRGKREESEKPKKKKQKKKKGVEVDESGSKPVLEKISRVDVEMTDNPKHLSPKKQAGNERIRVENKGDVSKKNGEENKEEKLKKNNNKSEDEREKEDSTIVTLTSDGEKTKDSEGAKKKKTRRKKKKKGVGVDESGSKPVPSSKPVRETKLSGVDEKSSEKDEEEEDDMKVSMEELFQDEDFVEEFAKDTAELEAKNRPTVKDTKLPGWGSWAGPDYKEKQKRIFERKKPIPKKKEPLRRDIVWLNPQRNDSIRKLQPKKVPFPYTSVQQYEASLRQPVSRGFVRETAHKILTKPEVVTKLGHIIKPLQKEHYVTKQPEFEH